MPLTEEQKQHRKARRLWAKALESGEYKPAKESLQSGEGFCCLGVACVVSEKHGVQVERNKDGQLSGTTLIEQPAVKNWLGLSSTTGDFGDQRLTDINDYAKRNPLKKIAKIIRAEPEGLFVD